MPKDVAKHGATPKRKNVPMTGKRRTGRPTVWNPTLEAAIFTTLESGCSFRDAAEANGIAYATMKERQRTDSDFSARLARARMKFKVATLGMLADAIRSGNVTAGHWYLERAYPEEWGRKRLEVTGADGGAVKIDAELKAGAEIRANSEASRLLHDALLAAVEADAAP
jgi:hypothetical protein